MNIKNPASIEAGRLIATNPINQELLYYWY